MKEIKITKERLAQLERKEQTLQALQIGGVDNWEWYGESMKQYFEKDE